MSRLERTAAGDLRGDVEALIGLLDRLGRGHDRLLGMIRRKREAIRTAAVDAIAGICREEQALMGEIAAIEKRRLDLVGRLTAALAPEETAPLSLREIASRLEEPARSRLTDRADALRALLQEVRCESSIVTSAARALSRHVAGIMQTVNGALSRVGIYERKGRIAVGSQLDYSIDMRS